MIVNIASISLSILLMSSSARYTVAESIRGRGQVITGSNSTAPVTQDRSLGCAWGRKGSDCRCRTGWTPAGDQCCSPNSHFQNGSGCSCDPNTWWDNNLFTCTGKAARNCPWGTQPDAYGNCNCRPGWWAAYDGQCCSPHSHWVAGQGCACDTGARWDDGSKSCVVPSAPNPPPSPPPFKFPAWQGNDRNGLVFVLPSGLATYGDGSKATWFAADGCSGMGGAQYQDELNPACNSHDVCYYCTGTPGWNLNVQRCNDLLFQNGNNICSTLDWWNSFWCYRTVGLMATGLNGFGHLSSTGDCVNGPHKFPFEYATKPIKVGFPSNVCNGHPC